MKLNTWQSIQYYKKTYNSKFYATKTIMRSAVDTFKTGEGESIMYG